MVVVPGASSFFSRKVKVPCRVQQSYRFDGSHPHCIPGELGSPLVPRFFVDGPLLAADPSVSQSLAVRDASFTVAGMATVAMEVSMSICRFHVQVDS